ncbi:MAG: hypothetical protein PVG65_04605 [Candidatus Thorarchaeota archaeon]
MPKIKRGRGRPKGSKNTSHGEPHNFYYWRFVVGNEKNVNAFIERGNAEQKSLMKQTLEYLQRGSRPIVIHGLQEQYAVDNDLRYFEEINGKEILRRLKCPKE